MSRVHGRGPASHHAKADAAGPQDAVAAVRPQHSALRRRIDVAAAIVASAIGGLFSAAAAQLPLWWAVAAPLMVLWAWGLWRLGVGRLGKLTAGAAALSVSFVVTAVIFLIPAQCPGSSGSGRCSVGDASQGGLLGVLLVGFTLGLCWLASSVWRTSVTVIVSAPGVSRRAANLARAVERRRRARRDSGIRWVSPDWRRDPVVWSAVLGTAGGAIAGAVLHGGVAAALTWAVGGFLALGAVPAAWRAGGSAGVQRRRRRR